MTREEIIDQCIDNFPLRSVGILRFINQDMIEAAIELVANPVAGDLPAKQLRRAFDQIIEIEQPFARLGCIPPLPEGATEFKRWREELG